MTAAQHDAAEDLQAAPASGPGARLREIRVSRKLSLEDVAAQLRLDPPRLEALENDAYDQLPGPTFVRGYLRGYARLVGVPAGPLLEAYDRYGFDTPALIPDITSRPQIRSSDVPVKLVTYVLAVLLLALVGIWWFSQHEVPTTAPPVAEDAPELPAAVEEADEPVILPPPPAPFGEPEPEPESVPAPLTVTPPAAPLPLEQDEAAGSVGASAGPPEANAGAEALVEAAPEPPPAAAGETLAEAPQAPPAAEADGRLEIDFVHDSWVEIRDAGGESLYYGTAKGGETVQVSGEPPLKVLLGYAHEAEVQYNNEPFDHRPYINKGLARFTLGGE